MKVLPFTATLVKSGSWRFCSDPAWARDTIAGSNHASRIVEVIDDEPRFFVSLMQVALFEPGQAE
jgi:hypothetical protein